MADLHETTLTLEDCVVERRITTRDLIVQDALRMAELYVFELAKHNYQFNPSLPLDEKLVNLIIQKHEQKHSGSLVHDKFENVLGSNLNRVVKYNKILATELGNLKEKDSYVQRVILGLFSIREHKSYWQKKDSPLKKNYQEEVFLAATYNFIMGNIRIGLDDKQISDNLTNFSLSVKEKFAVIPEQFDAIYKAIPLATQIYGQILEQKRVIDEKYSDVRDFADTTRKLIVK